MKLIAIDVELNKPSRKIIEIGAVIFQPTDPGIIAAFQTYVNPEEPIDPFITSLTGIRDDNVINAPNIGAAAELLSEFKTKYQASKVPVVWGAGRTNDVAMIYDQAGLHLDRTFKNSIIDVKGIYRMLANVEHSSYRDRQGLLNALYNMGLGWDPTYGAPHRATADAYHTARIYQVLSGMLKGANQIRTLT